MSTALATILRSFEFEGFQLRTATVDGDPLFNAADICAVAKVANVSKAVSRLDDDEKHNLISSDTLGGPQAMIYVTEPGFYDLVLSFRLRKEHPNYARLRGFKRWVTHDVLPTIRKTGGYGVQADPFALMAAKFERIESRLDAIEAKRLQKGAAQLSPRKFAPKLPSPPKVRPRTKVDDAADFLRELLASGPMSVTEVRRRADAAKINPKTLYVSAERAEVEVRMIRGRKWWALDRTKSPDSPCYLLLGPNSIRRADGKK